MMTVGLDAALEIYSFQPMRYSENAQNLLDGVKPAVVWKDNQGGRLLLLLEDSTHEKR